MQKDSAPLPALVEPDRVEKVRSRLEDCFLPYRARSDQSGLPPWATEGNTHPTRLGSPEPRAVDLYEHERGGGIDGSEGVDIFLFV